MIVTVTRLKTLSMVALTLATTVAACSAQVVRRERHFSQFTRSFTLPDNIKEDGIAASLDKGVLTVTVPKTEPAPKTEPKRIQVQGGAA